MMVPCAICVRCRGIERCPNGDANQVPPGWFRRDDGALFCGDDCAEKGAPQRIRPPLPVMVAPPPDAPPMAFVGACDALHGYDRLCTDPDYLAGYEEMMGMRPSIEAAVAMFAAAGFTPTAET